MMKKIFTFFCICLLISCEEDFIELAPEDQQSSVTFFQTESDFEQALTAAYAPFRQLMVNDFYLGEMRSDNTHYEYMPNNRGTANVFRESIADLTDDPYNNYTNAVYVHSYNGISRANIVLERIENATIDQAVKNRIVGEAQFIRAFYYFKLVQYFGELPLYLTEVKTAEQAFVPRSSVEEVYAQIIEDATQAVSKLEAPESFPQSGRASKGAATMLLAKVHMARGEYTASEELLLTLPSMGYQLLPDYQAVFSTANKNSSESIFEVQYMEGNQESLYSDLIYRFLPKSLNTELITGIATNNTGIGGWNRPTWDLINSYESNDQRLDASIGIAEGIYSGSQYLEIHEIKSPVNYSPTPGLDVVPYIKKYVTPHEFPRQTGDNWPIYRYSGALLLLAEAMNEQGKTGDALPYLNEVRARAGLDPIAGGSQEELRAVIAQERRVELAFENHRWHDLVRTGKAIEVMTEFGKSMKEKYDYLPDNSFIIDPFRLLFPIPKAEVDLYPELTQNPGY